jgi:copper chaperone CopZ
MAIGLTCSMCSNAINEALQLLYFVDKAGANIKNLTFEIAFKPNSDVDFYKLKKKVEMLVFLQLCILTMLLLPTMRRWIWVPYFSFFKCKSRNITWL